MNGLKMVKREKIIGGIYSWIDKLIEPYIQQNGLLTVFQDPLKIMLRNFIAPELSKFEDVLKLLEDPEGKIDFNRHLDSIITRLRSTPDSTLWKGKNFSIDNRGGEISVDWDASTSSAVSRLFGGKVPLIVFKRQDFELLKQLIR